MASNNLISPTTQKGGLGYMEMQLSTESGSNFDQLALKSTVFEYIPMLAISSYGKMT